MANGKTVAIFGGGIGGLTAAHGLALRGFAVRVYEKRPLDEIGGKARTQYFRAPRDRTPAGRARVPLLAAVLLARLRHHGAHPARPGGEGPLAARPRDGAERPGPPGPRAGRRDRAAQPGAELSRSVSSAVSRCSVRPSGQQSIPSGLSRTRGRPLIVSSKPPCEAPAISTSVPPGTRSSVTKAFPGSRRSRRRFGRSSGTARSRWRRRTARASPSARRSRSRPRLTARAAAGGKR